MPPIDPLSNREQEVVELLLEGKSNKLIASALGISDRTVEFHLKNIYAKYQVSSRTELILTLGKTTGTPNLGQSTVESQAQVADNSHRLNLSNWSTTLRAAVSKFGRELKMENMMNSTARAGSPMTFFESIRACFTQYAEFNGRASRSEFWWFALFTILVASAFMYVSQAAGNIFLIAILLPLLAAGARRLHDAGKSGWWQLFILAPVAGIVVCGFLWAMPTAAPQPDDVHMA